MNWTWTTGPGWEERKVPYCLIKKTHHLMILRSRGIVVLPPLLVVERLLVALVVLLLLLLRLLDLVGSRIFISSPAGSLLNHT